MSIELSRAKRILFLIAIMLSSISIMGELVITPIIYNFYEIYPDNITVVNTIISIPMLAMIFASLLATALLKRMSHKTVLTIGGILFALGGIFGVAVDNIWFMLLMRIPYGIGIAFVNVAAMALIATVYSDDEKKRGAIMGYFNAFISVTGAIMSIVSGYLAVTSWKNAYFTYWSAIPMIILFILFLPNLKDESHSETINETKNKTALGRSFWIMMVNFVIFNVVYGFALYFISSYVTENSLGNEAFIGVLGSLSTLGSFLFCVTFGFIYSKMGRNTIIGSYLVAILSMFLLFMFPTTGVVIAVCIVLGGSYGAAVSFQYAHCPLMVPETRINDAIGIVTAAISLGNFGTSYVVTAIMGLMGVTTVTPVCLVFAVISIFYSISEIVLATKEKRRSIEQAKI